MLMAEKTRSPEAIEREIERTRDELARSIDVLAERLSPKQVARRGAVKAREEAGRVAFDIGRMARREPNDRRSPFTGPVLIGAGLVATTIAMRLLLRRNRR